MLPKGHRTCMDNSIIYSFFINLRSLFFGNSYIYCMVKINKTCVNSVKHCRLSVNIEWDNSSVGKYSFWIMDFLKQISQNFNSRNKKMQTYRIFVWIIRNNFQMWYSYQMTYSQKVAGWNIESGVIEEKSGTIFMGVNSLQNLTKSSFPDRAFIIRFNVLGGNESNFHNFFL